MKINKKHISKIERITEEIVQKGFPELKQHKIFLIQRNSNSYFMATIGFLYWHIIYVDKVIMTCSDGEIRGCIAHELAHISMDNFLTTLKMATNNKYSIKREREIDLEIVKRGYGHDLLKFLSFHNTNYVSYKKEDGLTVKEIKKILKSSQ